MVQSRHYRTPWTRTRAFRGPLVALLVLLTACSSTIPSASSANANGDTGAPNAATADGSDSDIAALRARLAELEAEIAEIEADISNLAGQDPQPPAGDDGGEPAGQNPQGARFPTSPLINIDADHEGALLGVSTGLTGAERGPRFEALEQAAGRQLDIGHVFHSWDTAIPTEDDLMHLEDGRILMISWNGTDTIEIQNGQHDDWIRTQAASVRDLEQPVMLRWLWEMDANRRRAWVHSGEDFIAAWLHVRSIFDEVGADNAEFVWCPNEFLFWDGGDPTPWYPGDENVDWLCADGYNWADSINSPEWVDFNDIFGDFYAWAEPRGLPIIIGETGSNEALDAPQGKASWFRNLPALLQNDLPEIDAVVYFDKDFTFQGHADWRVDTSTPARNGWNQLANDPYFNTLTNG